MMDRRLADFPAHSTALAISPAQERSMPGDGALQHVRFFKGRSLDHADLRLEMQNAEARFGLMARVLADGVVQGFEVAMVDQDSARGAFDLSPGYGISPQGQDLTLNRRVRLDVRDLPRAQSTDLEVTPAMGGICALVLEPVSAEETRFSTAADKEAAFRRDQQLDPGAAPYQDARIVDGARLTLVRLNALSVGPNADNAIGAGMAELAEAERVGAPMADYTKRSIALCLMGLTSGGRILWVHRHAALRRGGGLPRALAMPRMGLRRPPRLGQAQVDAMLEIYAQNRRTGQPFDPGIFTDLPPAGVLPLVQTMEELPFPATWARDTVPIPISQLDALLAQTEALAGYDLSQPVDEVRLYLPVPDALFRRELLEEALISQEFIDAREMFRQRLADRLEMRDETIKEGEGALLLIDADDRWDLLGSYEPDPNAIDGEDALPPAATANVYDYEAEAMTAFTAWRDTVPDNLLTADQIDLLTFEDNRAEGKGLRNFIAAVSKGADRADDYIDFGFTKVQAEIYRLRQIMLDAEEATKLATFPVLAGLTKGDNALAISKGLQENFIFNRVKTAALVTESAEMMVRSGDRQTDMAMMFPIETEALSTPLMLAGTQVSTTETLLGSTALMGAAAGSISVESTGSFGLTLEMKDFGSGSGLIQTAPDSVTVQQFGQPTILAPQPTTSGNPYVDIFNTSRDVVYDEIALSDAADKRAGITLASAIPGDYRDLRTMTIADRLAASAAQQARTAALRTKADAFSGLAELDISMDGVKAPILGLDAPLAVLTRSDFEFVATRFEAIPGLETIPPQVVAVGILREGLEVLQPATDTQEEIVAANLSALDLNNEGQAQVARVMRLQQSPIAVPEMVNLVLGRRLDNDAPAGADEAELLAGAVEILESTVAVFRAAERRVTALRGVIKGATRLLEEVEDLVDRWRGDVDAADVALAEARHDMQAMRALFDEEEARIDALRDERQAILREHVSFVVYARPRRLRPHSAGLTTGRALPGVFDDPLPLALERPAALPQTLDDMIDILRDVPIAWFAARDDLLAGFGKTKTLDKTFHRAANGAAIRLNARKTMTIAQQLGGVVPLRASRGGKAARAQISATRIANFYTEMSSRFLIARGQIDLGRIDRLDWKAKRKSAAEELSLGDLIEGAARSVSAARAMRALEEIERVLAALCVLLRRVPAAVRLLWADKLSSFDGDPVLADIDRLPGWSALTPEARFDIRRLHGWLFGRMTPGHKEATALMSDVMQVALLLAANADADAVVKARLEDDVTVEPGGVVDLKLDLGAPEIGTPVWFGSSNRVRAEVSNVLKGRVQVTLPRSLSGRVSLTKDMPIFVDAKRLGPAGYGR